MRLWRGPPPRRPPLLARLGRGDRPHGDRRRLHARSRADPRAVRRLAPHDGDPGAGLEYAAFRATAGRGGLTAFYAVCGLQVIAVVVFLGLALASGRARGAAALAAAAGALWVVAHYASGFGALEATVVRATSAVPPDIAASFLRLNVPIHFFHLATLATALGALLTVPRSASRRKD